MSDKMDLSSADLAYESSEIKIKVNRNHPDLPEEGVIVDMSGDLNLYSTPNLKTIITKLMDGGYSKFFVNMESLKYIDSSGLGAFLSFQSKLLKMQGFIRICSPSKQVSAVLELTKLKSMLRVSRTVDDAIFNRT